MNKINLKKGIDTQNKKTDKYEYNKKDRLELYIIQNNA